MNFWYILIFLENKTNVSNSFSYTTFLTSVSEHALVSNRSNYVIYFYLLIISLYYIKEEHKKTIGSLYEKV